MLHDIMRCVLWTVHAVGDWEVCGDCFYAREHLYDMQWEDVDLEQKRCGHGMGAGFVVVHEAMHQCIGVSLIASHAAKTAATHCVQEPA